jgi:alpha-beta hydrolase superfamily lysophospholipase
VLNLTTSYQMKERAGLIGSTALHPILQAIAKDHPALRLHLVGHSFGGRLVTTTSAGVSAATILRAGSMSLQQAAFSHDGFALNWDK